MDGPGIESRWRRDFPHLPRPALGPTQPPIWWVPGLSRGKERPERDADPSPLLVPWSRKSRAIPLLPLWAVRSVQSLSACTRVHFTFYLSVGSQLLPLHFTPSKHNNSSILLHTYFVLHALSTFPLSVLLNFISLSLFILFIHCCSSLSTW